MKSVRKRVRLGQHHKMMAAFVVFLDKHWPLWRQHEGESRYHDLPRYHDLLAAFKAGWRAA